MFGDDRLIVMYISVVGGVEKKVIVIFVVKPEDGIRFDCDPGYFAYFSHNYN